MHGESFSAARKNEANKQRAEEMPKAERQRKTRTGIIMEALRPVMSHFPGTWAPRFQLFQSAEFRILWFAIKV